MIAMHWRALLHDVDRHGPEFSLSLKETESLLLLGISEIFDLAGEASVFPLLDGRITGKACSKVVELAVKLADQIRLSYFTANLEISFVEPGEPFNSATMECEDPEDGEAVIGTVALGLNRVGYAGEVLSIVTKPKVLRSHT